jgi:hypothetical protein
VGKKGRVFRVGEKSSGARSAPGGARGARAARRAAARSAAGGGGTQGRLKRAINEPVILALPSFSTLFWQLSDRSAPDDQVLRCSSYPQGVTEPWVWHSRSRDVTVGPIQLASTDTRSGLPVPARPRHSRSHVHGTHERHMQARHRRLSLGDVGAGHEVDFRVCHFGGVGVSSRD